jgi:hypothetical protein
MLPWLRRLLPMLLLLPQRPLLQPQLQTFQLLQRQMRRSLPLLWLLQQPLRQKPPLPLKQPLQPRTKLQR